MSKGVNIFNFSTDKDAETKGVEKDWNGMKVVVARHNNTNYSNFIAKEFEAHRKVLEDKSNPEAADAKAEEINKEAFVRHILVGWSGMLDHNDKEFKYNLTNARKVYDAVPDLVRDVRRMSHEDSSYRLQTIKSDGEDLKK